VWLKLMRQLKASGLVDYVYPEFFDNKNLLLRRKWTRYIKELHKKRNVVKVAVWPDYCYQSWIKNALNVTWVFPLHRMGELDFVLKIEPDFIAMPQSEPLRDYGISWFVSTAREYGFKTWLLGLHSKLVRYLPLFDATDITTLSLFESYVDATKLTVEEMSKRVAKIRAMACARVKWEW